MAATRIIVLLNLKPGKDRTAYEHWAQTTDIPTVNALTSIESFSVYEATGLLGGGTAPYQYVEVLDIADMDQFGVDVSTETMAKVAAEFQAWADPIFITTRNVAEPA